MEKCAKASYSSERFAMLEVERLRKKSKSEYGLGSCYLCHCGFYHITQYTDVKVLRIELLEKENKDLKDKIKVLESSHQSDRVEVRKDDRVKALQAGLQNQAKENKRLQKVNREITNELIRLKLGN